MTIDNELEEAAYEMETSLFDEDSHPDLLREAANHIRAQEARIAALTKDAEPINESLAEDIECIDTRYRGDPNYEHDAYYMRNAAANLVRSGYKLYTHPPAPKAITADMVTDEMVDAVEDAIGTARGAWDMVDHKELIAAACKTIGQAPIALALLTIDEVRTAYINANNDGFDFEGQLQKAFCKKNGLPHPTE